MMKSGIYHLPYIEDDENEVLRPIDIEFEYDAGERNEYEDIDDEIKILCVRVDGKLIDLTPNQRRYFEAKVYEQSDEWQEVEECEI